jgi:hypothetical protein
LSQYQQWEQAVSAVTQSKAAIAAPNLGTGYWNTDAAVAVTTGTLKTNVVTQHEYLSCYDPSHLQPSDYLLQPSSAQIHFYSLTPYLKAVHSMGLPFRVSEMNSMCSGGQPGVSDGYYSALWSIDAMFEMAKIGVDGVNWNTSHLGGPYDLFKISVWKQGSGKNGYTLTSVRPVYYGLVLFSRAAGNNAQLLPVDTVASANIKIWATKDSLGKAHLVILNKEKSIAGKVQITLPGYINGHVSRLTQFGGNIMHYGMTFAGQTFEGSTDGLPIKTAPDQEGTFANVGTWTISVQPSTAILLDLSN